jgi:hypothetical protein
MAAWWRVKRRNAICSGVRVLRFASDEAILIGCEVAFAVAMIRLF